MQLLVKIGPPFGLITQNCPTSLLLSRKPTGGDQSSLWLSHTLLPKVSEPHGSKRNLLILNLDDWVDGKLIPKGSVIILNAWGLHHDESKFPNPDTFDPDHFAGQTELAPGLAAAADYENRDHYGYGSGRRICPGIHLAERNLFLGIAKILWAFHIAPGKDELGQVIEPNIDPATAYSTGFLPCALPYAVEITPRSEARRATIMREFKEAEENVFAKYQT